jgi:hypothetical protein
MRGVAPEWVATYQSAAEAGVWRCEQRGGGGSEIAAAAIHDDYCDCADGSDEPGTSACAGLLLGVPLLRHGFYCASGLTLVSGGARIVASRVDDGVCDCCDGSDEAPGACADRCGEVREHAGAAQAARRRGAERKAALETQTVESRALLKVGEVDLSAMPAFGAAFHPARCVSSDQGEYTYEVCPFMKASQNKRGGDRRSFSLGQQWSWEQLPAAASQASCIDRHVDCPSWATAGECQKNPGYMHKDCQRSCGQCPAPPPLPSPGEHEWIGKLSGGEGCGGGPRRSLRLLFECGEEEALGRVDEPEPCTYSVTLTTPAAC